MNGVHDLGGVHGMGPVVPEKDEPVFHAAWEGRVHALNVAAAAWRKWNLDASRHSRELIPPADYLRMSYYEKWYAGLVRLLVQSGLVTAGEIADGRPASGTPKVTPALTPDRARAIALRRPHVRREAPGASTLRVGRRVRARNIHPAGHTRLPRYVRGKHGVIDRDHGVYVFPDTNAHFQGEHPQHVYSVRFAARELWGEDAAPNDSVYLDLWDAYLEPA